MASQIGSETPNEPDAAVWNGQRTAREAIQSAKPEIQSILDQGWQQLRRS